MSKLSNLDPATLAHNPRASLKEWMRYQTFVLAAYASHPHTHLVTPTSLAPTTFASRFRDAVRGCLAFKYPIENSICSHEDLLSWYGNIVVKHDHHHVYIGSPEKVAEEIQGTGKSTALATPYNYPTLSLEEVIAFTVLLSTGKLTGPVVVNHPPDISMVPDRPNVEILTRPDGKLILM